MVKNLENKIKYVSFDIIANMNVIMDLRGLRESPSVLFQILIKFVRSILNLC